MSKGGWIRPEVRAAIYLRDRFTCVYCLRREDPGGSLAPPALTLEHLIGRVAEGANLPVHLVTACRSCNSTKPMWGLERFATKRGLEDVGGMKTRIREWPRQRITALRGIAADGLRLLAEIAASERTALQGRPAPDPWDTGEDVERARTWDDARRAIVAEVVAAADRARRTRKEKP